MFNLFKKKINKKIELEKVVTDFSNYLQSVRNSVDEITKNAGISTKNNYDHEAAAFTYFIGWLAIDFSNLSLEKKKRFAGLWSVDECKRMNNGVWNNEIGTFILSRKSLYDDAMLNGDGRDEFARIIIRFLEQFDAVLPENGGVILGLHTVISEYLKVLSSIINRLNDSDIINWFSES